MEIWKDVVGYEGLYQVSNKGRVKSLERVISCKGGYKKRIKEKMLKVDERKYRKSKNPRRVVYLSKNGIGKSKRVYRLMAEAFIPNPHNLETVNHIDGNSLNDSLENLEWMSMQDNIKHGFKNGLYNSFFRPVIKLDPVTLDELQEYPSETAACLAHGMTDDKIRRAIRRNGTSAGYKWKWK